MRMKMICLVTVFGAASASIGHSAAISASPSPAPKLPPMFSAEQVETGQKLYTAKCAACHGADLQGAMGPNLSDPAFRSAYKGKPMRALYSKIISTMPQGEPGTLNEAQVLSLTALIISRNGVPVGAEAIGSASDLSNRTFPNAAVWK